MVCFLNTHWHLFPKLIKIQFDLYFPWLQHQHCLSSTVYLWEYQWWPMCCCVLTTAVSLPLITNLTKSSFFFVCSSSSQLLTLNNAPFSFFPLGMMSISFQNMCTKHDKVLVMKNWQWQLTVYKTKNGDSTIPWDVLKAASSPEIAIISVTVWLV